MSTPHTDNERSHMDDETQHTKEPWWWEPATRIVGAPVMAQPDENKNAILIAPVGIEANARRICAAVNATEGISTEALEQGIVAELVEALEAMLDLYGPYADMLIHRKGNRPASEDKRVVQRAREALAKARPEREGSHG